ncbi:MAG: glycosyltransferase family 4 protein [Anaerolineae bacterium]|nr:glycosyltransferase family 4 protein [Anaerolineae bacterium]
MWRFFAPRRPTGVAHISDPADWVLGWVAQYVSEAARQRGYASQRVSEVRPLRGQLVHFHDRYGLLRPGAPVPHRSNTVFVTWLHGDPAEAEFTAPFRRLLALGPAVRQVVTSCTITQQALLAAGLPPSRLTLIPLGVDTTRFVPPAPGQREHLRAGFGIPPGAFCVGSFQKDGSGWGEGLEPKYIKGPDVLLATLAHLQQQGVPLFVLLTGPARGYVRAGLERLGIPCHHAYVPHYLDVIPFYHALDACLITSRAEGGPMALMEAWATGVPVVSTRMGMPADWLRDGENGLLAAVADAAGLAAAALRLWQEPALGPRLAAQARRDVAALDWGRVAGEYVQRLYAPLLEPPA